ncbi:dynamin family protein [Naasia sp. SYSU D00057]|uniref:dynamin family protein n=1 Tax=Naasia sp. SYSU D00057 TaxID=2817380 RepID=UPI001B310D76|nr:dynamin family protein [Naasia sp. SYSU D00057]
MTDDALAGALALVDRALEAYASDPAAVATLRGYRARLQEPLRVALAGMVKAGKSTLLNAIIGEEIAPTDAGECTRVVTWYRYGHTPRVTLVPVAGEPRSLPVRRTDGRLALELGGTPPEEVARLVVDWPAAGLRALTLIDTPGIGSLSTEVSERSMRFLLPEDTPSEADAVVYLLRHLHATDLQFLESFRDTAAGRSGTVNSLAVLSRADEIGAGRIDALVSARTVADRYRRDGGLRALALAVVPVAGLLAQGARTLSQAEFAALSEVAGLDRDARERLLVSADRFVRADPALRTTPQARQSLLDRFGLFGIRLAAVLLRSGVTEPTPLAHELARRSGLDALLRLLGDQFTARAAELKARNAVLGVETLLRERPAPDSDAVAAVLERLTARAHGLAELRLLAALRTGTVALPRERAADAERLLGGEGVSAGQRLALPEDAPADAVGPAAREALQRWRRLAESPLADRATVEVCRVVIRSCEALLAERSAPLTPGLVLTGD